MTEHQAQMLDELATLSIFAREIFTKARIRRAEKISVLMAQVIDEIAAEMKRIEEHTGK